MRRYRALLGGSAAIYAAWTIAPSSAVCQDARKTANNSAAQHCLATKKDSARMPCYKAANIGGPTRLSQQKPIEPATWQLTRAPNPAGGPDSVSIAKVADATRSDQDITGLMLRCAEGATTEVLLVLIKPLPPQTHPKVTVSAGATTTQFTGTVLTSGGLVLLPEKASALVERAWQSIPALAVSIGEDRRADTPVELSQVKAVPSSRLSLSNFASALSVRAPRIMSVSPELGHFFSAIRRAGDSMAVRRSRHRASGSMATAPGTEPAPLPLWCDRRERVSGEFDRTLSLPVQLDPDRIKAEYRDGILPLLLPRSEQDKPRSIKIS